MTKKVSPTLLQKYLDTIFVDPSMKRADAACGIHASTVFRWIERSKRGDPDYAVEFAGEVKPFHVHLADSIRASAARAESEWRSTVVAGGRWRKVFHQGRPQWAEDEWAAQQTDETLKMLGIVDTFKRVLNPETGGMERVQLEIFEPISIETFTLMARSLLPDAYGDQRKIDVSVSGDLGVRVVGGKPVQLREVRVLGDAVQDAITDQSIIDVPPEVDMSDLIGDTEPSIADVSEEAQPAAPSSPPSGAPLDDAIARLGAKPASPLVLDALARIKALKAKNAAGAKTIIRPPPASACVEPDRNGPVRS